MLISDGNFNGQISASLEVDYNDGYAINGINDAIINNQLHAKNFEMTPNISAISSFYGLIAIYVNQHILVYDFETFLILKKFESTYFDVEIPDVTRLKFIEFQSDSSLRPIIFIETKTQLLFYILQSNSAESNTPVFSMNIQNPITDIVNLDHYLFLLIENRLFYIDCNAFSQPSPIQFDSEVHHICSKNSQTLFVLSHGNLFSLHIQEMSKLQQIITQLPPCFDMTAIYKENLVLFSYDQSQSSNLIMTFVNTTSNPPSSKSYKFSDEEFGFDRTKRFFYASSIHHPIFIISVENSSSVFTVQATQIDSVIVLQSEDYQICPPRGIDDSRQLMTGLYFVDRKPRNAGSITGYNPIVFWGNYQVFAYTLCGLKFECDPIEASVEVTFSSTQVTQSNDNTSVQPSTQATQSNDDDTSVQPSTQATQSNDTSVQSSTQVTQSNDDDTSTQPSTQATQSNDDDTSTQPSTKTDDAQSETLDTTVNSQPNQPDVVISVKQQIGDPNKGQEFVNPEVKTFDKPDSLSKQIKFECQEKEFDEEEEYDGSIKDISFYSNLVDISPSLNILAVYNSENENVEIYNLEQVLRNGRSNLPNEPQKTYHISSNDIRNITIISIKTRPLIGLSTTTGIILIDIAQECKEFQRIEIDEGGNDQIQYTDIRPNEIVCLSHNKTLFIYNFKTQTHQFLSSHISCYTISPKGLIFYSCDNRFYQYNDSNSEFLFGLFQQTISLNCVLNNLLFIISIREQEDGMNNPYVYTLYDYLKNEKISKYDFSQSDQYDDKLSVVSSPYNSFVIISNVKRYYTCNSIDSFNKYTLDDDDDIPVIYDDDCEECEVAKMFYLDNISPDLYPTYPSLIGFFGTNFIRSIVIRKKISDDELPFTINFSEENPIDDLPYATITRYSNSFKEIYDRNLETSDQISICVSFSSDLICLYSEQELTIFKYTDYLDNQQQELTKIQLPNIHWANFIEIDPPMLAVHSNEVLDLYSIENSTSQQLHQFQLGQFVRSIVNVGNFLFCLIQQEVVEIDCLNNLQKKNDVISTSPIEVIAKRNSNELLYISEQNLFSYNISTSQSSQIETELLPHCIDMASVNGSKVVLFTTTDEGWSAYQKEILNTNQENSITKPFNQLIVESNKRASENLRLTLEQLTNSINSIEPSQMNQILENLRQTAEDLTKIGQLAQTFLLVLCIIDLTDPAQISFVKFEVEDIKFNPLKKFIHCESENSPLIIFGESGSSRLFSLDTSIENDNVTLFSFPDNFMSDVFFIHESKKQEKDVKIISNVMFKGTNHIKIEQLQRNQIKQSVWSDKDAKEIENIFQKMQEQIEEIKNKEEQIMKERSLLYIEQYKNDYNAISFDDFHITSQQLLKEVTEFFDEIDEILSKCEQMAEDDTFLQQISEDDIMKFEQLYAELSDGVDRLRQLLGRDEFQQNI